MRRRDVGGGGDGSVLGGDADAVGVGDGVADEVGLGLAVSVAEPREDMARWSSASMDSRRTLSAAGLAAAAAARGWDSVWQAKAMRQAATVAAANDFVRFI